EFKWTRNLIVGSNFGLRLHDDIQDTIPPFRDNYQTSLFFTTILALTLSEQDTKDVFSKQNGILQNLHPRMFEIGRGGAFDMTENMHNSGNVMSISLKKDGQKKEIKLESATLYPKSDLAVVLNSIVYIKSKYIFSVIIIFVMIMVLIYVSSDKAKKRITRFIVHKRTFNMKSLFIVFIAYFAGITCIAYNICENFFVKEPLSFFNAISIWPTEILRLLSAILSICFLLYVWEKIKLTDNKIAKKYGFSVIRETSIHHPIKVQMFPHYWEIYDSEDKKCGVCFSNLWNEYLSLGSFDKRVKRTVMYTVVFMFSGVLLINTFASLGYGLFVPARGDLSFSVDFVVLKCISVPCMLFLTFFIVDHHKLFRRLIKLSAKERKMCLPEAGIKYREHAYQKTLMLADYTEQTKWLNVFSFIVLFLMIISRNSYFDNWNMSVGLLIIFVTLGIYSFASTIILHKEIKRCKDGMVAKLKREIICLHTKSLKVHAGVYEKVDFEMEQIKMTISAIEAIRKGAFMPLIQHPLFQAALLPFGSAGTLLYMNFFN
nr:hypothetical protein [Candidatus Brocadiales bacterium]